MRKQGGGEVGLYIFFLFVVLALDCLSNNFPSLVVLGC
jgi:hypothetical protein